VFDNDGKYTNLFISAFDFLKKILCAQFKTVQGTQLRRCMQLSTIVKNIEYIPLETCPDGLLGRYGSPRFFKNGILISGTQALYCFDLQGKFMYKISRIGKGPGEYQRISSYLIDEKRQRIEIMDQRSRKLLRFKLDDGTFIEEKNSILFAQNIELFDDNSIFFILVVMVQFSRRGLQTGTIKLLLQIGMIYL